MSSYDLREARMEPVVHPGGLIVVKYISGADRNNPNEARSHTYAEDTDGDLWPMCEYGWNRSGGERLSILRGWGSLRGHCRICTRRTELNLHPILEARGHKTRWF